MPVSAPPTGLDECLFFISLVSDFLAVRFSVSSGCASRRSVSTYAAILVLPQQFLKYANIHSPVGLQGYALLATTARRPGGVPGVAAANVCECILFWEVPVSGGEAMGGAQGRHPRPSPLRSVHRPLILPNLKTPFRPKLQEKQTGLLHRKSVNMFQSPVCSVP